MERAIWLDCDPGCRQALIPTLGNMPLESYESLDGTALLLLSRSR